jgi:hypothetical protein
LVRLALIAAGLALSACAPTAQPAASRHRQGGRIGQGALLPRQWISSPTRSLAQGARCRVARSDGWLSFAGSGQLAVGRHAVGSAADSAIVLPKGPARWGMLTLAGNGALSFEADRRPASLDGKPFTRVPLATNADGGKPTRVQVGALAFYVVKTGDSYAWRFRDRLGGAGRASPGLEPFPGGPGLARDRRLAPVSAAAPCAHAHLKGTQEEGSVPGEATFARDGRRFRLLPVLQDDPAQPCSSSSPTAPAAADLRRGAFVCRAAG